MKLIIRSIRVAGVVALVLFCIFGLAWRVKLTDSGLAAYDAQIKKADVSVSVSEQGRIIKVEGVQAPGQPAKPCGATLIFEPSPR